MNRGVVTRGLAIILLLAVTACSGSPPADVQSQGAERPMIGPPTVAPPPGLSPTDYGYSLDSYLDCLDDANVRYRYSDTGGMRSLDIVYPQAPELLDASIWCERVTTEPEPEGSTERSNMITRLIVECLLDRGYHVRTNTGDELVGADGVTALTWSIPDAEQNTPEYDADQMACTKQAEAAAPAPRT